MKIKSIATAALPASVALGPTSPFSAPVRADGRPLAGKVAAAAALPTLVPAQPVVEEVARVPAIQPEPAAGAVAAVAGEVEGEIPALLLFMGAAGANGALAADCDQICRTTTANGGLTTAERMQDADFALSEQFCLACTFSMAKSDALTAGIAGFTPDQIAGQCAAFGPVMGERGYSEYPCHHLGQGFGASTRPDLAMDWYQMALDAMGQGRLVVAPGMDGRDALIRTVSCTINGRAAELALESQAQEAALTVFETVSETAAKVVVMAPTPAEGLVGEPGATPIFVAPKLADLGLAEPGALPSPLDGAGMAASPALLPQVALEGVGVMAVGTQAAIMAARLPFLIFSSY